MGGRGFTLIELLIVIGIMGLILSLVGPLTVNQLESAQRTQEREQFHRHLEQWKFNATHWRMPVDLELEGRHLRVYSIPRSSQRGQQEPDLLAHYEYEQLRFPVQHLSLNAHGYWSHTLIEWYEGSQDALREKELVNRGVLAMESADAY